MLEICKIRTNKSSPDLFNFYVISARHDMANDAGRATTCSWNFKAPWLQTERTKNEGPSEKMSFNGEQFENFKPRKPRNPIILWRTKQKNHKSLKAKTEHEPCTQEEINWSKIEKKHSERNCSNSARPELRSQGLICSTFTYSRLVMTWPMTLAGLPRAVANSKPHDYKQNVQKMKCPLKKWALTGNSLKFSNQENRGIQSSYEEQNKRTTKAWRQKLNMNHVLRKNLTEANLKKAFRIKLFELCKTRTKKSSPDLINFM